ncbi:MAG: site-2 protease family protein [Deltaproteobacteria bacterium]|nr:site-2 protease family protein [Candidatus Anaeroferrophillacea bacterium]
MKEIMLQLAIMTVPVLLAVTVHELAHGLAADRFGDHTPRMLGRLTLNPLKHLDPVGTLVFLVTRVIGWAKPIPINPRNLTDSKRQLPLIALAGPAANFLLAGASALVYHVAGYLALALGGNWITGTVLTPVLLMARVSVFLNLALGFFNLLPVPPLDGSRIVGFLLPAQLAYVYGRIEQYGFIIILALVFTGGIELVLVPLITYCSHLLIGGAPVPFF